MEKEIKYPSGINEEGFFYENEEEHNSNIRTHKEHNKITKQFTLSDGKKVIVRELKGKDVLQATKIAGNSGKDNTNVIAAMIFQAATFDGHIMPMEDILELRAKDFSLLMQATTALNF